MVGEASAASSSLAQKIGLFLGPALFLIVVMILSPGESLELDAEFPWTQAAVGASLPGRVHNSDNLEEVERNHILSVLEECGWKVRGKGGAAERLGLKRTTLQSRMKKLGIQRPSS
jgi:transcriptional regulator with GAF, ATPase, and Fis domain